MAKDQLARGARRASYGQGGIGESPLLVKLQEQEAVGTEDRTTFEEPVHTFEPTAPKRKKFTPLGASIMVRQAVSTVGDHVYTSQEDAMNAAVDKKVVIGIATEDTVKQDTPAEGTVLHVGPGLPDQPMTVQPDDEIVFGKYSGAAYRHNGEWVLLMQVNEVIGIITTQDVEDEVEETYVAPTTGPFAGQMIAEA